MRTCPLCDQQFQRIGEYYNHFKSDDHQPPWRDEDTLRQLYRVERLKTHEIADRFGCAHSTISKWLDRHDIETYSPGRGDSDYPSIVSNTPQKLTDGSWLKKQYIDNQRSQRDIASELDCSHNAVSNWLDNHDIPKRGREELHVLNKQRQRRHRTRDELQDESWLRHHYIEKDLSTVEIAEELGVSHYTVYKWLNLHDIEIGTEWDISGEEHWSYRHGERATGKGWNKNKKEAVRERDGYRCASPSCSITQEKHRELWGEALHVHHLQKVRDVDDPAKRNAKENLITLCRQCHSRWERMSDARIVPQIPGVNVPQNDV